MSAAAWMWTAWGAMAGFVGGYGWAWEKAGAKKRKWLEWGLVALVAAVSAASAATHEPWRDELHTWLQAREMGLGALWKEMGYEGHFIPWHLLLWPLAHFGAPVWTMGLVSWGLNALAVGWLARRSPLTGLEKAVAGMSCLFLYVNPVISRCYVLVPLALFGVASLWNRRDERPVGFGLWVVLLANTHLYLEGAAVAVFGVYAWENVLRRADGKGWRECGRQWAGLAVMAAGGTLALVQVLPSVWESSVPMRSLSFWLDTAWFFQACVPQVGGIAMVAGLALLGVVSWRQDQGAFLVYAAGLAYMWGFSVFLYEAHILNRALLWWPLALSSAWAVSGKGGREACLRVAAVAAMGVSIARPDMTWKDLRLEYDPLPGACSWIAEQYGRDVEVWINNRDVCTEAAEVYLDNVRDWGTGDKAGPFSWERGKGIVAQPIEAGRKMVFEANPGKEDFLALGSMAAWSGVTERDLQVPGVQKLYLRKWGTLNRWDVGTVVLRVRRWGKEWVPTGLVRYSAGDREGAVEAWARAVREDGGAWEAMNNLAWVCAEEGRVEEARAWMDRAMENDEARGRSGVWDTEAAVRRAEGDEEGAREAEGTREKLRKE